MLLTQLAQERSHNVLDTLYERSASVVIKSYLDVYLLTPLNIPSGNIIFEGK